MAKELVKEYADLSYPNDKRMNDYILKSTSEVVKTSLGYLIAFDKPDIKTSFCFGHGQNGITTSEETNIACDMADYARTNEQYFIEENLKGINEQIKELKEASKVYIIPYKRIPNCGYYRTQEYYDYWNKTEIDGIEATKEDIELLLNTLQSEKEKFIKRLNTYLKRYGLSKIHSWTYLVD